jgi:hypothetical protein
MVEKAGKLLQNEPVNACLARILAHVSTFRGRYRCLKAEPAPIGGLKAG